MPTYFYPPPRLIRQTVMAEDNQKQPAQDDPSTPTSPPAKEGQKSPQEQNPGQRRNDRRDRNRPRHHTGRRDPPRRDPQPARPPQQQPARQKDANADNDEEETERDRSSPQNRHHRGGRLPKKIIEEWENDPYCE